MSSGYAATCDELVGDGFAELGVTQLGVTQLGVNRGAARAQEHPEGRGRVRAQEAVALRIGEERQEEPQLS